LTAWVILLKKFDALPDAVKNQIYIRIGQRADTLPPASDTEAYVNAVREIAEEYLQER